MLRLFKSACVEKIVGFPCKKTSAFGSKRFSEQFIHTTQIVTVDGGGGAGEEDLITPEMWPQMQRFHPIMVCQLQPHDL